MASISMQGSGSHRMVCDALIEEIQKSGITCELIDKAVRSAGGRPVTLMVFEKYYMRSSNRASLSVLVVGDGNDISVDAVASGGGQGALFRFSWGAEYDFVGAAQSVLEKLGFQ